MHYTSGRVSGWQRARGQRPGPRGGRGLRAPAATGGGRGGAGDRGGFVGEWAEVPYVPSRAQERRDSQPYRYLALRIRPPQGLLFGDGSRVKHFAVVTNDWETEGRALLEWHRGKAGTIEQVPRGRKDDLGGGGLRRAE